MFCMSGVIVWDIETVPDLKGFAAANGHVGKTDDLHGGTGCPSARRWSVDR
jgi:hypothetical protein